MSNDPNTQYILDRLDYAQKQVGIMQADCMARIDTCTQTAQNCVNALNTCQDELKHTKSCPSVLDAGPETICECVVDYSALVKDMNTRLAFAEKTVEACKERNEKVEKWNSTADARFDAQTKELGECHREKAWIVQPGIGAEVASCVLILTLGGAVLWFGGQLLWRWMNEIMEIGLERRKLELDEIKKMHKDTHP